MVVNSRYGLLRTVWGISAGGSGPVDGVRPSDLELPLDGCADAVLTPPAGPLVESLHRGPPLEVAIGAFGPDVRFTPTHVGTILLHIDS